jgi:hypothetical protein
MKLFLSLLAASAALLFASTAGAQLKPPSRSVTAKSEPKSEAAQTAALSEEQTEKQAAGQLAASGWLVLLDRKDWGRAWETSSTVFRANVPLDKWMDNIPKVRDPMGAFVERKPAEAVYKTTLAGRPDGEYVTVIYVSKFAQRELQEVVTTVRDTDGKWRVTGYSTR